MPPTRVHFCSGVTSCDLALSFLSLPICVFGTFPEASHVPASQQQEEFVLLPWLSLWLPFKPQVSPAFELSSQIDQTHIFLFFTNSVLESPFGKAGLLQVLSHV